MGNATNYTEGPRNIWLCGVNVCVCVCEYVTHVMSSIIVQQHVMPWGLLVHVFYMYKRFSRSMSLLFRHPSNSYDGYRNDEDDQTVHM